MPPTIAGSPKAGAARELEEETGYVASELVALGASHVNPATHTNSAWTFLALGAEPTGRLRRDANEELEVVLVDLVEFASRVVSGKQPLQGLHAAALWRGLHGLGRSTRSDPGRTLAARLPWRNGLCGGGGGSPRRAGLAGGRRCAFRGLEQGEVPAHVQGRPDYSWKGNEPLVRFTGDLQEAAEARQREAEKTHNTLVAPG